VISSTAPSLCKSSMMLVSDLATDFFIVHHLYKSSRPVGMCNLLRGKSEKYFRDTAKCYQFFLLTFPFSFLA
jgi:hypothetical protein